MCPAPPGSRLPAARRHNPVEPKNLAAKRGSVRDEQSRVGPWLRTVVAAFRPSFFSPSVDSACERALGGGDRRPWTAAGKKALHDLCARARVRAPHHVAETIGEYVSRPGRARGQRNMMVACVDALCGFANHAREAVADGTFKLMAKSELLLKMYSATANNRAIQFPSTAETLAAGPEAARLIAILKDVLSDRVGVLSGYSKQQIGADYSRRVGYLNPLFMDGKSADAQVSIEDYEAFISFATACGSPAHFVAAVRRYAHAVVRAHGMLYACDGTLASGTPITTCLQMFRHALAAWCGVRRVCAIKAGAQAFAGVFSDDGIGYFDPAIDPASAEAAFMAGGRDVNVVWEMSKRASFCSAVFVDRTPTKITMPDGEQIESCHNLVVNPARIVCRYGYTFKGAPGKRDGLAAAREAADLAREHCSAPMLRELYLAVARVGGITPNIPDRDPVEYESTCAFFGYDPEFLSAFAAAMDEVRSFPTVVSVPGFEEYVYDAATEAGAAFDGLPYGRPFAPDPVVETLAPDDVLEASAERNAVRDAWLPEGARLPRPAPASVPVEVLVSETSDLAVLACMPKATRDGGTAARPTVQLRIVKGLIIALLVFTSVTLATSSAPPPPSPFALAANALFDQLSIDNSTSVSVTTVYEGVMVRVEIKRRRPEVVEMPKHKSERVSAAPRPAGRKAARPEKRKAEGMSAGGAYSKRPLIEPAPQGLNFDNPDAGGVAPMTGSGQKLIRQGRVESQQLAVAYLSALYDPINATPNVARAPVQDAVASLPKSARGAFTLNSTYITGLGVYRLMFGHCPSVIAPLTQATFNTTTGDITGFTSPGSLPVYNNWLATLIGIFPIGHAARTYVTSAILDVSGAVVAFRKPGSQLSGAMSWTPALWAGTSYGAETTMAEMLKQPLESIWIPQSPSVYSEFVSVANVSVMGVGTNYIAFESTKPISIAVQIYSHYDAIGMENVASEASVVGSVSPGTVTDVTNAVALAVPNQGSPTMGNLVSKAFRSIVGAIKDTVPAVRAVTRGVSAGIELVRGLLKDEHKMSTHDGSPISVYTAWLDIGVQWPAPRCLVPGEFAPHYERALAKTMTPMAVAAWSRGYRDVALLARRELRARFGATLDEAAYWRAFDEVVADALPHELADTDAAFIRDFAGDVSSCHRGPLKAVLADPCAAESARAAGPAAAGALPAPSRGVPPQSPPSPFVYV